MTEVIYWIDTNGTEHQLSGQGDFDVLMGTEGRFMPPVAFTEEEMPFQHGSTLRQVQVKAREVDLPLVVRGTDEITLRQAMRRATRIFNPLYGDGRLKVVAPDGMQRELYCRYSGGLEISESRGNGNHRLQKAVVVLKAFDPFWYDTSANVQTFTTGQAATFFPFFPLRLSSSSVFADASIDNTGDVETFPEWIINGPGEGIILRNLSTGDVMNLDVSLEVGESITIDAKPKVKTVTKNDGTNLYYTLSDDSSLWALQEGVNNIRLEMSDATADSSIQLTYRNRYWGP